MHVKERENKNKIERGSRRNMIKKGYSTTSVLGQDGYNLSTHFCMVSYRVKPMIGHPSAEGILPSRFDGQKNDGLELC